MRPRLGAALAVLTAALLVSCTSDTDLPATPQPEPSPTAPAPGPESPTETPTETPSETPTETPTPTPSPSRTEAALEFDTWVVGARPLPETAQGFGEVRPTPRQLRDRLLPTVDVLPPPPDGRYHAEIRPVTEAFVRRTGLAWGRGCPVDLDDLRHLEMSFWGFDRKPHTGQMVVHERVARDVAGVFRKLYAARFPLEQMALVTQADLDAPPTGDGNNTAAYACRPTTGGTSWSAHAYGLAIDVNPFNNPYSKDGLVLPELASAYLDRSWRRPGMIHRGDVVTRAFAAIGWTWGGDFRTLQDLHHFSATGG